MSARGTVTAPPAEHHADPGLKTYVQRVGPFPIEGYQTYRHSDKVKPPPVPGSIVGMDVRVVDRRGRVIPQSVLMLHHMVFTNGGQNGRRRDAACPHRPVNERFYGTSEELRAMTLPRGYGYRSAPRDRWKMIWMIMNHRKFPRDAYIEYRTTVDTSPDLTPVTPYWLSVVPCVSDPQYTVPGGGAPGSVHERTKLLDMPQNGRIVAIGGHLHGGGRALDVRQPRCGDRLLYRARPTYAPAGDPLYRVKPLLHEPDPKNISWLQSGGGWRVRAGEQLKVSSLYDAERPHMRVMGIAHAYVARDDTPSDDCDEPGDRQDLGAPFSGRSEPPAVRLTLASLRGDGTAVPIARPPGRTRTLRGSSRVIVDKFDFRPRNLSVPLGSSLRWVFRDSRIHDATVVSGPRGFATPTVRGGRSHSQRFKEPGLYKLYCSIHPVQMSQTVRVRPPE